MDDTILQGIRRSITLANENRVLHGFDFFASIAVFFRMLHEVLLVLLTALFVCVAVRRVGSCDCHSTAVAVFYYVVLIYKRRALIDTAAFSKVFWAKVSCHIIDLFHHGNAVTVARLEFLRVVFVLPKVGGIRSDERFCWDYLIRDFKFLPVVRANGGRLATVRHVFEVFGIAGNHALVEFFHIGRKLAIGKILDCAVSIKNPLLDSGKYTFKLFGWRAVSFAEVLSEPSSKAFRAPCAFPNIRSAFHCVCMLAELGVENGPFVFLEVFFRVACPFINSFQVSAYLLDGFSSFFLVPSEILVNVFVYKRRESAKHGFIHMSCFMRKYLAI